MLGFVFLVCFASLCSAAIKPNILLILVDDLKPVLGCYGDTTAKTPNMDRLAESGMRFDIAYCNQAVCAPSRFTLMLGSHSTSTGLYGLGSKLRETIPDAVTMPQYFAKYGYRTESLGKVFHIGHGNEGDAASFSVPHFHDKVVEYLDPRSTDGGKLTREEAFFSNQKLGEIKSLPRGAAFESPDVDDEQYADGRVAAETIKRLQSAKARREKDGTPFFIAAGFARPHLPFSVPKKYWDMYDPSQLPMPQFEDLPTGAPAVAGKRGGEITNYAPVPVDLNAKFSDELKRKLIHGYYAGASFVDAQVGKLVDELNRLKLSDDTIIVLWGDHGFHLGDLGIWTKHTNYEQATRIPILMSAPGMIEPSLSTKHPVESVDIFPTLAELAGLPTPDVPQPIDGLSLVPILKEPMKRIRDHAYHVYPNQKLGRSIRTERYRLVEWQATGDSKAQPEYELYDYQTDPLEKRNLAADNPGIVSGLQMTLSMYPPAVSTKRPPENMSGVKTPSDRRFVVQPAADQFPNSVFNEKKTDRKPGPVMDATTIRAGLKSHDRALFIKSGWIRDPFIMLGPDQYYYLTGTQPNEGDPREAINPYNIGLGDASIVGNQVRVYRSRDLIEWESLGVVFSAKDFLPKTNRKKKSDEAKYIWAPELHWLNDRWALIHCPRQVSSLVLSDGSKLSGPWTHPMNNAMGERHDPSLFQDDDGSVWMLWGNTFVAPLSNDLSKYTADPVRIDPSGTRPGPDGKPIDYIGHEGATMIKVGGKYVHLGTAWSTDQGRKGSYNLYYCVADKITGPYGPRKFVGRFLGHGTPFKDKEGHWWCTAFFNGNVPPLPVEGIQQRDLREDAQTINEQGVTMVPLDVRTLENGEVHIRAKDPAYATPGPDEVQKFK
jgi:iduronate 2-sulfatase